MTGQTLTVLYCDADTRDPVDGMRTICGHEFHSTRSLDDTRTAARKAGWEQRGQHDYCPACVARPSEL